MKKIIEIQNMSCKHCAKKVSDSLKKLESIKKVKVDFKKGYAMLESLSNIDDLIIKEVVENLGYQVLSIKKIK